MKKLSVAKAEIFIQACSEQNLLKIKINSIMALGQILLATFLITTNKSAYKRLAKNIITIVLVQTQNKNVVTLLVEYVTAFGGYLVNLK